MGDVPFWYCISSCSLYFSIHLPLKFSAASTTLEGIHWNKKPVKKVMKRLLTLRRTAHQILKQNQKNLLVPVKEEHLKFHIPFASNSLSNSSHPSVKNKNKSVTVPAISKPSDPDKSQASKIPKLPPPPVLTPPPVPPAPTFTPKIPANPNHRYSGALGTIQFAGVSSNKTVLDKV